MKTFISFLVVQIILVFSVPVSLLADSANIVYAPGTINLFNSHLPNLPCEILLCNKSSIYFTGSQGELFGYFQKNS